MPIEPTASAPTTPEPEQPAASAPAQQPTSNQETTRRFLAGWNAALNKDKEPPTTPAPATAETEKTSQEQEAAAPTAQTAEDTAAAPAPAPTTTATTTTTPQPAESAEERAARLEREVADLKAAQERQRIQGQTQEIQKAYQELEANFAQKVNPLVDRANALAAKFQKAQEDGDEDQAAEYYDLWNTLNWQIQERRNEFAEKAKGVEQQYHAQRRTEHEQTLAKTLKQQGIDYEEIRKVAGEKFDPTNPYAVLQAALKVTTEKHKAEVEELKAKSKAEVEAARKKWTTESPASRTSDQGGGGGSGITDRSKLTTTEVLARALKGI